MPKSTLETQSGSGFFWDESLVEVQAREPIKIVILFMPKKVHCPLCFTLTDLAWLAQHGQNVQIVSINRRHFLNQIINALVTQPMLQLRPNQTELRSMDYYHQILCRFWKCKRKVPPPSLLSNEKSPFTPPHPKGWEKSSFGWGKGQFLSTEGGRWRNFLLTFSESTKNLVVIIHRS